jgi:predicted PurR-regulated permease PerM
MSDRLLDNLESPQTDRAQPGPDANAAAGPAPATTIASDRSTPAEAERRRILRLQASALLILAAGAVLSLIYIAKLVLIVVLVSILISFVLAPVVDFLGRVQIPRGVGSFIAVLLLVLLAAGATYASYSRAISFMQELPAYKARIQAMAHTVQAEAEQIQRTTETVLPASEEDKSAVTIKESSSWTNMLSRNASSVSDIVLSVTFVPFLVFFMLSWQDHVRSASVMLFSMENRNTAYVMLGLVARMIRSFIVGNFIIGVFLSLCSMAVFGLMGLPYFYFLGVISGFLSLIPYLGLILAVIPPLIADLGHLTMAMSLGIVGVVLGLHLVAMNVLYPKILGKRLQLNPLALTLALLFWAWLWGAMGLILAVPITGALKIICDHIERLRPYGDWMGE